MKKLLGIKGAEVKLNRRVPVFRTKTIWPTDIWSKGTLPTDVGTKLCLTNTVTLCRQNVSGLNVIRPKGMEPPEH